MQLGEKQTMVVVKKKEHGVYLADSRAKEAERVLLPSQQVPDGTKIGDKLDVFLYRDSEDRLIATTNTPALTRRGLAVLTVVSVNKLGAFLDWGLEKDLFLPFRQMTAPVNKGEKYLVSLYIDKSDRLCATMKVYHYLSTDSPYHKDDRVEGIVYEVSEEYGAYVAVDAKYSALIPKRELGAPVKVGQLVEARVTAVKPDGKLDLSLQNKAYLQMDQDAENILKKIMVMGGALPYTDKRATPEQIKEDFGLSKSAFKRAVGKLLKEKKIEIAGDGIRML